MRIPVCLLVLLVASFSTMVATTHTVISSGFTFSPGSLAIEIGDTVEFSLALMHNVAEVSKATWDANDTISNGGFRLDFGGGTLVLTDTGTYYYVCQVHASFSMKGVITVTPLTGSLTIRSFADVDGNFSTTGDRVPKDWSIKLYKDSVGSGIVVDSTNSGSSLDVGGIVAGTYVAVVADSISWSHLDVVVDGTSQGGTAAHQWPITIAGGDTRTVDVIQHAAHIIINSGFTFVPDSILVGAGDAVHFLIETMHTAREVDETAWLADDTTSNGGFDLPFGGGSVVLTELGTHHYVCVPHASIGMKGRIIVASSVTRTISDNWNMLSVPFQVFDASISALYPTAGSTAFSYQGNYQPQSVLVNGIGYWLKFNGDQNVTVSGIPIARDTINVQKGWNMMGSISFPVPTGLIGTNPSGIIGSAYFGYNGGYFTTDTIDPGYAYWIKVSQAGTLMLDSTGAGISPQKRRLDEIFAASSTLIIRDARGRSKELYLLERTLDQPMDNMIAELPPLPPEGAFDVRFRTGRQAETLNSAGNTTVPIQVSSAVFPITVEWNLLPAHRGIGLQFNGEQRGIQGIGRLVIPSPAKDFAVIASGGLQLPAEYSLERAYPDPFNPRTFITYTLPVESNIRLRIYNVLGQLVATLSDGIQAAGRNSTVWDASSNSSGVYIVQFDASPTDGSGKPFAATTKIVLQK